MKDKDEDQKNVVKLPLSPPRQSPRLKRAHSSDPIPNSPTPVRRVAEVSEAQSPLRRSPRLNRTFSPEPSISPRPKKARRNLVEEISVDCASGSSATRASRRQRSIPSNTGTKGKKKPGVCGKKSCGPCAICSSTTFTKYFHLSTMDPSKPLYQSVIDRCRRKRGVTLGVNDCFCNGCREKAKKGKSPTKKVKNKVLCTLNEFELCANEATSQELIQDAELFEKIFSVSRSDISKSIDFTQKLPFCKRHYMLSYNFKCNASCDCCKQIIHGNVDRRYSIKIDIPLATTRLRCVYSDVNINEDSIVCSTCYMLVMKPRTLKSLDDVLHSIEHVDVQEVGTTENDLFHEGVLNIVCKHMCEVFKDDRGLLFVEIQEYYSSATAKHFMKEGMPSKVSASPRSRNWLLCGIRRKFGKLLEEHQTNATNMSIMLTYKYSNIKQLLHKLLHKTRWQNESSNSSGHETSAPSQYDVDHDTTLYCAGVDINQRLKTQARKAREHFKNTSARLDLRKVDFEELLKFIDPKVWNMFTLISLNDEEGKKFKKYPFSWDHYTRLGNKEDDHTQLRFMRRVFLIFTMQFIMNHENLYPFQMIHANMVKRLSNSSKLVMACNRLGFCASEKALDDFLTFVDRNKKPLSTLTENAFSLVSVDNIDSLSPYAAVTADDACRSWHGTSVMAQQPLPHTQILGVGEKLNLTCIKVFGDGRCFYRCLAVWAHKNLIHCTRNCFGVPNKTMFDFETSLADEIREGICSTMANSLQTLTSLPEFKQSLFLEDRSGQYFVDFNARVRASRKHDTYAGTLEVAFAAYIMRRQIHLYQVINGEYETVAFYPANFFKDREPVRVLYTPDTGDTPGHFDLLNYPAPSNIGGSFVLPSFQEWLTMHSDKSFHDNPILLNDCLLDDSSSTNQSSSNVQYGNFSDGTAGSMNFDQPFFKTFVRHKVSFSSFHLSHSELMETAALKAKLFMYGMERLTIFKFNLSSLMPSLKCKFAMEESPHCEKSSFAYVKIYNEKADSMATMTNVLSDLHSTFGVSKKVNHLVVVGDLKTFEYMMKLKMKYKLNLDWLIPWPGDWHILKNFQEVLMKVFWDAGLKEVAKLKHKSATFQKLSTCSNFKRTHRFLLQIYEALLVYKIKVFLNHRDQSTQPFSSADIFRILKDAVLKLENVDENFSDIQEFMKKQKYIEEKLLPGLVPEFEGWSCTMASKYKTFAFWDHFLQEDMFFYIQLFLGIRSRNWNWRMAALKKISQLFHAFDRYNYARYLPLHINQISGLPEYVLHHFQMGGFSCSIKGNNFSCVGADEAHESLINKDTKTLIVRNPQKDINKLACTIEFQAEVLSTYFGQIATKKNNLVQRDYSPSVIKQEQKLVMAYAAKLESSHIFDQHDNVTALYKAFTKFQAPKDVETDLLNYAQYGKDSYNHYIRSNILKDSSVKSVIHKKNLKTFSERKPTKRTVHNLEKEKKLVMQCHKRALAALKSGIALETSMQFIETPRAICTVDEIPNKGTKSVIYEIFRSRYVKDSDELVTETLYAPPIVHDMKKTGDCCLIAEGMNMIYKKPIGLKTFSDYSNFLIDTFILPYILRGYKDIRILFDQSGTQGISPKVIEQKRRDKGEEDGELSEIDDATLLPPSNSWRSFLCVRHNKHLLCNYLCHTFLQNVQPMLSSSTCEKFIVSGGFQKLFNSESDVTLCATEAGINPYHRQTNHEESDTQIFLHVVDTDCATVHIKSIDRDIACVGLPLMNHFTGKQVFIQYKDKPDLSFVHMNALQTSLLNDSDLEPITLGDRAKIIQTVYIQSGCDCVSYFAKQGKSKFYRALSLHAAFITGASDSNIRGSLAHTDPRNCELGLLAFYRLIGTVYFMANRSCLSKYNKPDDILNQFNDHPILDQHHKFLQVIREATSNGVYEDDLLPSNEALKFHWLRACWVGCVWGRSTEWEFDYPSLADFGWSVSEDGSVRVIWDSDENISNIRKNVLYLTRGCGCKKSHCMNRRCKCKKENRMCTPGCTCKNCENCNSTEDSGAGPSGNPDIVLDEVQDHVSNSSLQGGSEESDTNEVDIDTESDTDESEDEIEEVDSEIEAEDSDIEYDGNDNFVSSDNEDIDKDEIDKFYEKVCDEDEWDF